MALDLRHLKWVKRCIDESSNGRLKIASFGYPDLLVNREHLESSFDKSFVDKLEVRKDASGIIARYDFLTEVFDAVDFFAKLGCEYDIYDIVAHQGNEEFLDLNQDIPESLHQKYDVVLDPGTLEHCFNAGIAIKNMSSMVKVGGHIIHHNPMIMVNHGFYNFSPTFYFDFYARNGFELQDYPLVDDGDFSSSRERKADLEAGVCNNLIAQRKEVKEITWPGQYEHLEGNDRRLFRKSVIENKGISRVGLVPTSSIAKDMFDEYQTHSDPQMSINLYDSMQHGNEYQGISISTIESVVNDNLDKIVVTSYTYANEIVNKLIEIGFPQSDILIINGGRFKPVTTEI